MGKIFPHTPPAVPALITIDRATLHPVLAFLARNIVERRSTVPILSMVRVTASPEGKIRIVATDLDISAEFTLSGMVDRPGAFCLNASAFADVVKAAARDAVITLREEDGRVAIMHGRSRSVLGTLPLADFPMMRAPAADAITADCEALAADLARVAPFIGKSDGVREYLAGVSMAPAADGVLAITATNGRQLARIERPAGGDMLPASILPAKGVKVFCKAAKGVAGSITIAADAKRVAIDLPGVRIVSRLIDDRYPDIVGLIRSHVELGFQKLAFLDLEPGLLPGDVEVFGKALGALPDVEAGEKAFAFSSPAAPGFYGLAMRSDEGAAGYYADGDVSFVAEDGSEHLLRTKGGYLELSAAAVARLAGPVDTSTHVVIPKQVFYLGKMLPPGWILPTPPKLDPKRVLYMTTEEQSAWCAACKPVFVGVPAIETEAPQDVDHAPAASLEPAKPESAPTAILEPVAGHSVPVPAAVRTYGKRTTNRAEAALAMLTGARRGLGLRLFDDCFENGDGADVAAVMVDRLRGDPDLARAVLSGSVRFRDQGETITVYATAYLSPALFAAALDATGRPTPTYYYAGFAEKIDAERVKAPAVEAIEPAAVADVPNEPESPPTAVLAPVVAERVAAAPIDTTSGLAARVEALEAALAALSRPDVTIAPSANDNAPPPRRSEAQRRAIVRAWNLRRASRTRIELEQATTAHMTEAFRKANDMLVIATAERDAAFARADDADARTVLAEAQAVNARDAATSYKREGDTLERRLWSAEQRAAGGDRRASRMVRIAADHRRAARRAGDDLRAARAEARALARRLEDANRAVAAASARPASPPPTDTAFAHAFAAARR